MLIEHNISLQPYNTLGVFARAAQLFRIQDCNDFHSNIPASVLDNRDKLILGGGSNIVLTRDVECVLKIEISGLRIIDETPNEWIIEAGAGESWHDLVAWSIDQQAFGLENLALIPGTVGAAPVQNIGAYGVELKDYFHSLDAFDLEKNEFITLNNDQCRFAYRDSAFKHAKTEVDWGLFGRLVIVRVRLALSKSWQAQLNYADLQRLQIQNKIENPNAAQIFNWVCEIRNAKLPNPNLIGNAGSFFKNPTINANDFNHLILKYPNLIYYTLPNNQFKLAAGWLIDSCGWKGQNKGLAGVYEKQALVLINLGSKENKENSVKGSEIMQLAHLIQQSVFEKFGVHLEIEPAVI